MEKSYRIAMIASRSHRRGPDSRLIRLVREFERFLAQQEVWAIWGAHLAIRRVGLLNGALQALRAGRSGGLVEITHMVVADKLDVVIHLMDPRDPTATYPEANALKRECIAKGKLFLSTYMSAVEWMSLVWKDSEGYILAANEGRSTELAHERVALIAHDRLKVQMLKFALLEHRELLARFSEIIATGTTGKYLGDPASRERLRAEWEAKLRIAEDAKDAKEISKLSGEIECIDRSLREDRCLRVTRRQSGPDGGDVEIAHEVLQGAVRKVIFFEDPYTARPHEPDIQLLERTCRVEGEHVVCISDPESADEWAKAWRDPSGGYFARAPGTVLRELERHFRGDHVLRVVLAPTNEKDDDITMSSIYSATAWYLLALIDRLWEDRLANREDVKIAIPWGNTMGDLLSAVTATQITRSKLLDTSRPQPAVTVMPLAGLIGTERPSWEANVLAEKLAATFPTNKHHSIPGLAFVRKDADLPLRVVKEVERLVQSDIVLLIGAPIRQPRGIEAKTPVWPAVVEEARLRGSVGEVSGIFLRQDGSEVSLCSHRRVGLDWKELQQIASDPRRRVILLIGSRPEYLKLARALLKSGLVSTLVTDLRFGRWLLDIEAPA